MRLYVLNQGYTHGGSAGYMNLSCRDCAAVCVCSHITVQPCPGATGNFVTRKRKIIAAAKFPRIYGCSSTTERLSILIYGSIHSKHLTSCFIVRVYSNFYIAAANSEPQATYSGGEYTGLSELPEEVQRRGEESKTEAYQTLELDSMNYTSMYSKVHKQQTPMVEVGDHMYAVIDSTRVEPPSQYATLDAATSSAKD